MAETYQAILGERRGQFVVFEDGDGGRHAVRVTAIVAASDLDQCRDATILQLPGGRAVMVRMPLEGVLDWFVDAAVPRSRTTRHVMEDALALWSVGTVLSRILLLLLDEGLVTRSGLEEARHECLGMVGGLREQHPRPNEEFAVEATRLLRDVFKVALPDAYAGD